MSHVDKPLPPELRTRLAAKVAAMGSEVPAAAEIHVSPGALTRALAGLAVKASTRALIEIGVAAPTTTATKGQ
jgi:hypothetical protein